MTRLVDSQIRIVDPVETRSQPPVRAARRAASVQHDGALRGRTVAFVYLEDWRNFETFLAAVEALLRERFGVSRVRRVTSSLRRGPLTADDLAAIRGSAVALVGLGA